MGSRPFAPYFLLAIWLSKNAVVNAHRLNTGFFKTD
jgi:hypothetical protein